MVVAAAGAGTAMQKDHRYAIGMAALLHVDLVNVIDPDAPDRVGLDWWIEGVRHSPFPLRRYSPTDHMHLSVPLLKL